MSIPETEEQRHSPLRRRQAGLLLHPTSLPGPWANGDLGAEAYRFVDFLIAAGQSVWQLLPLGPTNGGGSPYQCFSAHAGNPLLVSMELLVDWGWLEPNYTPQNESKIELLGHALKRFRVRGNESEQTDFECFKRENSAWLEDFALYSVLKEVNGRLAWNEWPAPLRDRESGALELVRETHADSIELVRFEQYVFFKQWHDLKRYANERGITIFGDLPIFVAHDSADVWAQRHCFLLDTEGRPRVVAGVPPDYFSETGQRWGNPHYDWSWMESNGFRWWHERIESQLKLFDLIRIDHFRGFESYWEIPAEEETAIKGHWVKAPGDAFFASLRKEFDPLPVIAEDLGIITDEVLALRTKYALPGMKILHFAFDGGANNPYLPHNIEPNSVIYTGTHDNDTTLGWYEALETEHQEYLIEYLGQPGESMPWPLITAAYASVANLAVVPVQDILELGSEHRMNTPGTSEGNWKWRLDWSMAKPGLAERLRRKSEIYGRL